MSLPPFLFSSAAANTARSAFASTSAATADTSVNGAGMKGAGMNGKGANGAGAGPNFRQAFAQLSQGKAPEDTRTSPQEPTDPLLGKLNLLMEGDLLPEELKARLRSMIEDMQQDVSAGGALADQGVVGQQFPDAVAALRELVDLLTGGKVLPVNASADATDLSEDLLTVDPDAALMMPYAALSSEAYSAVNNVAAGSAKSDLLAEQGGDLDLGQWISGQEKDTASSLGMKSEVLAGVAKSSGFPADVMIKPDSAASPLGAILPADLELSATVSSPAASAVPAKADLLAPADTAMRVQVAFGHARWSEALAERAAWLAGQQIHSAELQLDPPELGPLQVRISVHQDQAVVSFVSANPQVREALDQSMMRLRDLLQEQGMQLVDAGVSDHPQGGDGDAEGNNASESLRDGRMAVEQQEHESALGGVMDTRYGVDDFA
jgi:hypothetical protein